MRELRTEIQISAPIDKVWQVITDFDHWKDWNPTVNRASGNASVGSKLSITICGEDCQDAGSFQPIVLQANPPKYFRWRATMMVGFLFKNDRVFELNEKNGGTELIHREEYSGLMVPLAWKKLNKFALPILEKMNKALKDKLEASS